MSTATTSASERAALAHFASLPIPVTATQTFSPLLPSTYRDGAGVELEGRPDALFKQPRSFTYIESKNGKLNNHLDKASCHRALMDEYTLTMHDGVDKPYNVLTAHFQRTNLPFLLENAWNNSLFKVLALQAEHGWQRYVVCFKKNPTKKEMERYSEVGLVFCTEATVMDMLRAIELAQHGYFVPFVLKTRTYCYSVTPDHTDSGKSADSVRTSDRSKFEGHVTARKVAARNPLPF